MTSKSDQSQVAARKRGKLIYLFLAQVALLVLYPFFDTPGWTFALFRLFAAGTFFAGVYGISRTRSQWITALALAIPAGLLNAFVAFYPQRVLMVPTLLCTLVFMAFTLASLLHAVLRDEAVTHDTIYGALSVYLLMASVWGVMFLLLETLQPNAFVISHHPGQVIQWADCLFYSFVTLTSLGYGDIVPMTAHARSLSVLEAVSGIMYMAVLVARVVGIYSNNKSVVAERSRSATN